MGPKPQYSAGARASVITMKQLKFKETDIQEKTGIPTRTIRRIWQRALRQGLIPDNISQIREEHTQNKPKSGRPKKLTDEKIKQLQALVTRDRYGREKTCKTLG